VAVSKVPTNNHSEKESTSLRDYFNLIRINLVPVLIISITGLIVGIIYAVNAPNIFKSTTELKLAKPQGNILDSPLIPAFQDFGSDRFVANEIEVLKSYRVRAKVAQAIVDTFNITKDKSQFSLILNQDDIRNSSYRLKSPDEIIKAVTSSVSIDQKRGLDIVEVSSESKSPFEAALIVNCYAKAYKEINLGYSREQMTSLKNFLAQQREQKLSELSNVEETLRNYQEQKGIIQLDEQAKELIKQSSEMDAKMNTTKIDLTVSEKTLNQLKEELKKRNPDITNYIENFATEPYIKKLQEQIADYKAQKDRASSSSSPNSQRLVNDFDNKINDLRDKLTNQLSVYRAGILASSPDEIKDLTKKVFEEEVKYQSLSSSYRKMNEIVGGFDRKMNQLPTSAVDLARLMREKEGYEKLYTIVEEKYQAAIINEQSTPGNALIIDEGLIARIPAKPNRILIVVVGLFLGVGMGIGFAFIRSYLDNTVKTPEDIQNKNINLLSWIPQIEGLEGGNKEFEFIVAKKPDASASEAYRALRTRIKFSRIDKDALKVLLVTSPTAQEGKTTTSVNLAGCFAQANLKTVLLDADLRKPRMHNVFNQKRFPGFSDYFFGQASFDEIVRKTAVNNLDFITAGTIPPNPSEIVSSTQMESFIEKLRGEYDQIIIDSPPIIAVTDSEILSAIVDGTILVVSANHTEMELMEKAVQLLNHERSSFIGVVLNNFTYRSGYGSYYKYYYYYSHAGNGSKKNRTKV
jgi:capsular exopolysaccharide synthesis family protein